MSFCCGYPSWGERETKRNTSVVSFFLRGKTSVFSLFCFGGGVRFLKKERRTHLTRRQFRRAADAKPQEAGLDPKSEWAVRPPAQTTELVGKKLPRKRIYKPREPDGRGSRTKVWGESRTKRGRAQVRHFDVGHLRPLERPAATCRK